MELQLRMIFFSTAMLSSASAMTKTFLNGVEGRSITFPHPVLESGFLTFKGKTIAAVKEGVFEVLEDVYKDRLFWNQDTGLFTVRVLQRADSGVYVTDSRKGRDSSTSHYLTVYEAVKVPVTVTLKARADSCTLLCSVNQTGAMTLLWYKDQEILKQKSSALSLPLTVQRKDFTSSYRCAASSPVEEKSVDVDVMTSCRGDADTISSTTVSVKAEADLKDRVGQSVTFPDPVPEFGFLTFEGKTAAVVKDGKFETFEERYKDRLFWNNQTGLFTISSLQEADSGVYVTESKKDPVHTSSHELRVYKLSEPGLGWNTGSEFCSFNCYLSDNEETTLLVYKDDELLVKTTEYSHSISIHRQDLNSSYRCVVVNPVEEKTRHVKIIDMCLEAISTHGRNIQTWWFLTPVMMVAAVVVLCIIFTSIRRKMKKKREREREAADRHAYVACSEM